MAMPMYAVHLQAIGLSGVLLVGAPGVVAEEANENPSNPLSKGRNTDLRAQYFDLGDNTDRSSYNVEGATILSYQLKRECKHDQW